MSLITEPRTNSAQRLRSWRMSPASVNSTHGSGAAQLHGFLLAAADRFCGGDFGAALPSAVCAHARHHRAGDRRAPSPAPCPPRSPDAVLRLPATAAV